MNYKETGFREIYKNFIAMPLDEGRKEALKAFPGIEKAQGFLGYGYIDHEAGLTLEVLALAVMNGDKYEYLEPNDDVTFKFRIGSVEEIPFQIEPDNDGVLRKKYAKKVNMIEEAYSVSKEVEKSRAMETLDGCRHEYCIDDVQVHMVSRALENIEVGWVRIEDMQDELIIGTLLIEPYQDYGVHIGEQVVFFVAQDEETGDTVCICDCTQLKDFTDEDFSDGIILKGFLEAYNEKQDEESWIRLLAFLRDCYLWVPFVDVEDCVVPDVLQSEGKMYMPAFSSEEEMYEYGDEVSKIQMNLLKVISLARENKNGVSEIIINAFSDEFSIPKDLWETIEGLPSVREPAEED